MLPEIGARRPGVFPHLAFGTLMGGILFVANGWGETHPLERLAAFVAVGFLLVFSGWSAGSIWLSMISPMVGDRSSGLAFATRLPFWFMAGGIGYTVGILVAKKLFMLEVIDIPVHALFAYGAKFGLVMHASMFLAMHRPLAKVTDVIRKDHHDTGGTT